MTVAELIDRLKECPQEKTISAWDGDFQHPVPVIKVHSDDDEVWLETSIHFNG